MKDSVLLIVALCCVVFVVGFLVGGGFESSESPILVLNLESHYDTVRVISGSCPELHIYYHEVEPEPTPKEECGLFWFTELSFTICLDEDSPCPTGQYIGFHKHTLEQAIIKNRASRGYWWIEVNNEYYIVRESPLSLLRKEEGK